jgi:hypothetical protein
MNIPIDTSNITSDDNSVNPNEYQIILPIDNVGPYFNADYVNGPPLTMVGDPSGSPGGFLFIGISSPSPPGPKPKSLIPSSTGGGKKIS